MKLYTEYEKEHLLCGYVEFDLDFLVRVVCLAQEVFYRTDKEVDIHISKSTLGSHEGIRYLGVTLMDKDNDEDYPEEFEALQCYANEKGEQKKLLEMMEGWANGKLAYHS